MIRSLSILVIDDDRGLARLIQRTLAREDLNVSIALSGTEAIEWCAGHRADLLLIDLKLPDVSAPELIERLSPADGSLPFIIITGEGDERAAVDMMKRGALDYLIKDAKFLELIPIVVRRALTHLAGKIRLEQAETRLRREHEFSDAILGTSGALMLVLDASGGIVRFNHACEVLTGFTFQEVKGREFWEIFLAERDRPMSKQNFREILGDASPRLREGYLLTKDGRQRLISWSVTSLTLDGSNDVEFVIASGMDITERRHLEREVLQISEQEQKRIGQDLHDGLCQLLAGIDMMAVGHQKKLARQMPQEAEAAARISGYIREANEQARMLSRGLSPVELETNGLMSALQELARNTASIFSIDCRFICAEPVEIEDHGRSIHLYRIAQETVSNAIRHGQARTITITLCSSGASVFLEIRDDGSGFDSGASSTGGLGLRSIRHRISVIGGTLDILRNADAGMTVLCAFPLLPPDREQPKTKAE